MKSGLFPIGKRQGPKILSLFLGSLIALSTITQVSQAMQQTSASFPRFDTERIVTQSAYYDIDQAADHINTEDYLGAIVILNQAVEKSPTNLFALYNLGISYYEFSKQQQDPATALTLLEKAEETLLRVQSLNPSFMVTYFKLGKIALMKDQPDQAATYYRMGLEEEPDNAVLQFNLAGVLDQQGKFDEAIAFYEKATANDPNFTFAYNNLGLLYEQQGKFTQAETVYRKALNADKTYNYARLNLGNLYAEQNRYEKAMKLYQEALTLEPGNAWAYLYQGNVYFQQGDYTKAADAYRESIALNPAYPTTYYLLSITLNKLQRVDEAILTAAQYIAMAPQGAYANEIKSLMLVLQLKKAGGAFGFATIPQ